MSSILNMLAAVTGGQAGLPEQQAQDDEEIVVDGWKKTKRNWLGKLADGVIQAYGGKPIYEGRMQERDMKSAMEGYTHDPLTTIQRISQFNPELGLKLHEQYTDNQRQQGNLNRQNNLFDFKVEEAVTDRVANMMGVAKPETWGAMREQALRYAKSKGIELPFGIPEAYDENAINMIRFGEIPVVKQEGFKRSDERLRQGEVRLGQGQQRIDETERHHYVQEGQAATNETGRATRAKTAEEGRNMRSKTPGVGPRFLGKPEFSPDKKKVRLRTKTGYEIYDISRGTDNARLIKKIDDEED